MGWVYKVVVALDVSARLGEGLLFQRNGALGPV